MMNKSLKKCVVAFCLLVAFCTSACGKSNGLSKKQLMDDVGRLGGFSPLTVTEVSLLSSVVDKDYMTVDYSLVCGNSFITCKGHGEALYKRDSGKWSACYSYPEIDEVTVKTYDLFLGYYENNMKVTDINEKSVTVECNGRSYTWPLDEQVFNEGGLGLSYTANEEFSSLYGKSAYGLVLAYDVAGNAIYYVLNVDDPHNHPTFGNLNYTTYSGTKY